MCGIVGYTGQRDALEVLMSGLGQLEYGSSDLGSQHTPCTRRLRPACGQANDVYATLATKDPLP